MENASPLWTTHELNIKTALSLRAFTPCVLARYVLAGIDRAPYAGAAIPCFLFIHGVSMRKFRTLLGATLAGACALAVVPGTASAAPAAAPQQATADLADTTGAYYPVAPARLMDTRSGLGGKTGKIGPLSKFDLQVTGRGGVPTSGVGAVVLNVTIANPTMDSFVTAYPAGEARPDASSVNFAKGWLGSNNVTVKIGSGGKVSIYNRNGSTDVVVDVVGFYAKDNSMTNRNGGQYEWFTPERVFDTREDPEPKPTAGTTIEYSLSFDHDPERNQHVKAFVLNLTAVAPAKDGFLTAWSGVGSKPVSSTVNYKANTNVPNLAFVQTTPCTGTDGCAAGVPKFRIYTSAAAHIIVDLVGVVDDGYGEWGMRFSPLSPTRILDSRVNLGTTGGVLSGGEVAKVTAPSAIVTDMTDVLAMNLTAVKPTRNTVLTVWPADADLPKPSASNLNPYAGQIVSNAVLGVIGPNDAFNVHNLTGDTHVVADVVGTFYYPAAPAATLSGGAGKSKPQMVGSSHR
ncbi:hypothetical protein V6U89_07185 [Micromonospora sp. CPCC 206171]|uniref:hypothetical protein n=1 Tax=Micromonospora sp. CPCC 206171 TaxID=3122405 RepID=UPI002FF02F9E